MNKKEVVQILAILRSAYPNVKIDNAEATAQAWLFTLGEFSASSVMKAVRLHMSTSKFFPAPSEIREKMVRAEIVYKDTEIASNRLEDGNKQIMSPEEEKATEEKWEAFLKWIGFGYPNDIED